MDMTDNLTIEGHTAVWNMPLTQGEVLGTYSGQFVFKCYLSPIDQLSASRLYKELVGPSTLPLSEHEGLLAFALVQLKYRVIKAPPFWLSSVSESGMSGNIPDLNVIRLIFEHAFLAEDLFKKRMTKERESVLKKTITIAEELLQQEQGEE